MPLLTLSWTLEPKSKWLLWGYVLCPAGRALCGRRVEAFTASLHALPLNKNYRHVKHIHYSNIRKQSK